jgi:ubiquinone/menaquinone biosynthesis C-methylase UbiE
MGWTDILRCPKTGNRLHFDGSGSILRVEHADVTYPVIDGIADFCPKSNDRVATAYDKVVPRYDSYMLSSTTPMRVLGRVVWGFASDRDPIDKVLALLPEQFDGILLDVPVGTGIFTASLYRRYPDATILGVDCSLNMLQKARARFLEQGVNNVHLIKAGAAHLPVSSAAVDMVLSMNGWHAFADKQGTTAEMHRVLRRNGTLIACGYVKGARRLSDWFVRRFAVRNGFFTPPFFTAGDLARQFTGFTITRQGSEKSVAWFEALKEGA